MSKHLKDADLERLLCYTPLTAAEMVKARYWIYRNRGRAGDPAYDDLAARVKELWPKRKARARATVELARLATDEPENWNAENVAEDAQEFNGGDDR